MALFQFYTHLSPRPITEKHLRIAGYGGEVSKPSDVFSAHSGIFIGFLVASIANAAK